MLASTFTTTISRQAGPFRSTSGRRVDSEPGLAARFERRAYDSLNTWPTSQATTETLPRPRRIDLRVPSADHLASTQQSYGFGFVGWSGTKLMPPRVGWRAWRELRVVSRDAAEAGACPQ